MEVQKESLGPAFTFDDDYRNYWSYIPHFIHSPFYVYAYAFGDCLVNSLYAVYEDAARRTFAEISRHAASRRHASATRSCWRPSVSMPPTRPSGPRGWRHLEGLIDELEDSSLAGPVHERTPTEPIRRATSSSLAAGCGATPRSAARWRARRRGWRGSAISAGSLDRDTACGRAEGGAGRAQGPADEGRRR